MQEEIAQSFIQSVPTIVNGARSGQNLASLLPQNISDELGKLKTSNVSDLPYDMSSFVSDVLQLVPADIMSQLFGACGVTREEFIERMKDPLALSEMSRFYASFGISDKQIANTTGLIIAMNNGDVKRVEQFLTRGVDVNKTIIRDSRRIVHFCKTRGMLNLLLKHGLDLSINEPLVNVPFKVFKRMVKLGQIHMNT